MNRFSLFLLCLGTGCSTFNSEWKQAAIASPPPDGIEGRWQGTWHSETTQHTDRLRCLITPSCPGNYRARFHAKFYKVFSFGYTVPLQARKEDGVCGFSGSANLRWYAGGVYHYEGQISATNFLVAYRSKRDRGTFQMNRPMP